MTADFQAMGLALSLRRLDLIEMIFLTSRAPQQGTSKQTRPVHDEGLLRYVLNEVISGASGSDTITPEFRQDVSHKSLSLSRPEISEGSKEYDKLTSTVLQAAAFPVPPQHYARLAEHHDHLGAIGRRREVRRSARQAHQG
jgi:26S proteasome regulatory subunit N2